MITPEICPICGHDVPTNARACPECGADSETGWGEDDGAGGLDMPEDEFDYDEFVAREFGSGARPPGIKAIWWVTAIVLIIAFVSVYLLL